jgi:hypothetical protein
MSLHRPATGAGRSAHGVEVYRILPPNVAYAGSTSSVVTVRAFVCYECFQTFASTPHIGWFTTAGSRP